MEVVNIIALPDKRKALARVDILSDGKIYPVDIFQAGDGSVRTYCISLDHPRFRRKIPNEEATAIRELALKIYKTRQPSYA